MSEKIDKKFTFRLIKKNERKRFFDAIIGEKALKKTERFTKIERIFLLVLDETLCRTNPSPFRSHFQTELCDGVNDHFNRSVVISTNTHAGAHIGLRRG